MPPKYPSLAPAEVVKILEARGFAWVRSHGDHRHYLGEWKGRKRLVTVDWGVKEISKDVLKSVIRQSGMTREEFYGSTKRTAKKIGI
jgi:predicted RNA binding protein YcfA (HicA-like mRNA interferase family)